MNHALIQDVVAEVMRRLGDRNGGGFGGGGVRAGEDAPANEGKRREAEQRGTAITVPADGRYGIFATVDDAIAAAGDAQKKLMAFETEAQKVLENLIDRGQKSRKEVEGLLQRFNGVEKLQGGIEQLRELNPLDAASMKKLGKKANAASQEVRKRIEDLQNKVIEGVGVASQAQVKEINKELIKLSKKLDSLVGKKGAAKEVRN